MGYWLKSCWSFCVCVIHPCAGVLPFWVPYLPNTLTDFFDIWRIGSPYLHPPNLQIRLAISFFVVEISPYLCHLPLHSVSYILSDLGIRSHNSHQTSHIISHRHSAFTSNLQVILSSHSSPLLPLHFVHTLCHISCICAATSMGICTQPHDARHLTPVKVTQVPIAIQEI